MPPIDRNRIDPLLRAYAGRVKALVRKHCAGRGDLDADDIEQEIQIRIWRTLESDRSEAAHASYLQKVVISVVVDALRRAKLRVTAPLEAALEVAQDPVEGPEARSEGARRARVLMECLAILPDRRRAAVELHLQGRAHAEIGALVGVSDEAVRKLVTRGLVELRTLLQERGVGANDG